MVIKGEAGDCAGKGRTSTMKRNVCLAAARQRRKEDGSLCESADSYFFYFCFDLLKLAHLSQHTLLFPHVPTGSHRSMVYDHDNGRYDRQ